MTKTICKICGSMTKKIFDKTILNKYKVGYYKCVDCGFIQTEKPHWLKESYSDAITSLDIGLVNRNISYSNIVEKILYNHFDVKDKFLDFAGGYGMFTRIMRDKGFDFYHEDKYCDNLFAKYFEIDNLDKKHLTFELVTAFELMEHIENPFKELDYIFSVTDNFLFSTELIPEENLDDWWYLGIDHGQHISFYSKNALQKIADRYGKRYYSNGYIHIFTNKNHNVFNEKSTKVGFLSKLVTKKQTPVKKLCSKTQDDFNMIRNTQQL